MPYLASNPTSFYGKSVGDGQCVAYVRAASMAPHTSNWKRGELVKAAKSIARGTVIATFDDNGRYGSRKDRSCHTAIFLQRTAGGIVVLDQWVTNGKAQVVHERTIRFNNSSHKKKLTTALNIMLWSKYCLLALIIPLGCSAKNTIECPAYLNDPQNLLDNAQLFDGPVKDKFELVPDNEDGASWDISSYKTSERRLILLCIYKKGSKELVVPNTANSCTLTAFKGTAAWCN